MGRLLKKIKYFDKLVPGPKLYEEGNMAPAELVPPIPAALLRAPAWHVTVHFDVNVDPDCSESLGRRWRALCGLSSLVEGRRGLWRLMADSRVNANVVRTSTKSLPP